MRVHTIHARELAAPAERVGELLDGLGGEEDRLWPAVERWPTTRLELERPLRVGGSGRHDVVRYTIEDYEPSRRLGFRFAPGLGLDGTHGFLVEALSAGRSRLTHTLECRVEPKLRPLYPLLRRQHDALIEDILDQAELAATGQIAHPARWPLSVRIANRVEVTVRSRGRRPAHSPPRPARSRTTCIARTSAVAVPTALVALSGLHGAWALGWRWPGGTDRAFAERVLGSGATEAPPAAATWAVALALLGAAAVVGTASSESTQSRPLRLATWGVSAVFLARGAISVPVDLFRGLDGTYERLDLAIYSPLCLALGIGTAALARRASPAGRPSATGSPVPTAPAGDRSPAGARRKLSMFTIRGPG